MIEQKRRTRRPGPCRFPRGERAAGIRRHEGQADFRSSTRRPAKARAGPRSSSFIRNREPTIPSGCSSKLSKTPKASEEKWRLSNLLQEFPPVSTRVVGRGDRQGSEGRRLRQETDLANARKGSPSSPTTAPKTSPDWTIWMRRPAIFPMFAALASPGDWRIREEIDAADPEQANRAAQSAVAAGAEEIAFLNVAVRNASDLGMLLAQPARNSRAFPECRRAVHSPFDGAIEGAPELGAGIDRIEPAYKS